jgi:hypothetical protein
MRSLRVLEILNYVIPLNQRWPKITKTRSGCFHDLIFAILLPHKRSCNIRSRRYLNYFSWSLNTFALNREDVLPKPYNRRRFNEPCTFLWNYNEILVTFHPDWENKVLTLYSASLDALESVKLCQWHFIINTEYSIWIQWDAKQNIC